MTEKTAKTFKAEQKYVRISPRKIRLVVQAIKKMSPLAALDYLRFCDKRGALPLAKTIKQAIANAQNNDKISAEQLVFHRVEILEGPTYKRWRAVSRGRAHHIFKRTSHIKVILKAVDNQPDIKSTKREKSDKKEKK